ncbi:hypothetical protein B0I37DRAFT_224505 [Chaetomium sp. MPI-CAGE-AT-0009]|nr:hypothetical protein B0I37DRAFT_224505 [Chaetomium sp. MPI-CAGE-AT-0009]
MKQVTSASDMPLPSRAASTTLKQTKQVDRRFLPDNWPRCRPNFTMPSRSKPLWCCGGYYLMFCRRVPLHVDGSKESTWTGQERRICLVSVAEQCSGWHHGALWPHPLCLISLPPVGGPLHQGASRSVDLTSGWPNRALLPLHPPPHNNLLVSELSSTACEARLTRGDPAIVDLCACSNLAPFPTHTAAAARQSVVGNGPG